MPRRGITKNGTPGQRNGRLVLIEFVSKMGWLCKCDCGVLKYVKPSNLRRTHSCGCLIKENCTGRPREPAILRFWQSVDKNGPVAYPDLGPCWIWTKSLDSSGYGQFHVEPGLAVKAHVFSWNLHNGTTKGLHVLHKCDIRGCVNPDHLFLGTLQDNSDDCARKDRAGRKLSNSDVEEIRALYATGLYSRAGLKRLFGTNSSSYIGRIVKSMARKITK